MGRKAKDLTGYESKYYTVLRRIGTHRHGKNSVCPVWLCRCACGTEFAEKTGNIVSGQRKSCGCMRSAENRELFEMQRREKGR